MTEILVVGRRLFPPISVEWFLCLLPNGSGLKMTTLIRSLVSSAASAFFAIASIAVFDIYCEADDSVELADLRTALISNGQTWRQFDILMRSETFVLEPDVSPEVVKNVNCTTFTRVAVDFDKDECFCFVSGKHSLADIQFDRVGICKDGNTGIREFPGQAGNLKFGSRELLHTFFVPDLRCLSLQDYPVRFQIDASRGGFDQEVLRGPHFSPDPTRLRIRSSRQKDSIELLIEGTIGATRLRYHPKTSMPIGIQSFRKSTIPWTLEAREDYTWEERDGVYLPIEIGRDQPDSVDSSTKDIDNLTRYRRAEIVQIHWLSFNRPLDPKLFELSTVNDISKLRKLIDPVACGADRLK
jgi:hypothetical protein